jgi:hypothetical protein
MLSLLPLLLTATIGAAEPAAAGSNAVDVPSKPAVAALAAPPTVALLDSPMRHVRTTDRFVQGLLRLGVMRSPTFASLMERLNASDVIVYIEAVRTLPTTLAGRLLLLPMGKDQRYLRIQIAMNGSPNELVSLIGHELRHAIEVADSPGVKDEAELVRLYERIGTRSTNVHCYETDAARSTARLVRKEMLA